MGAYFLSEEVAGWLVVVRTVAVGDVSPTAGQTLSRAGSSLQ